MPGFFHAAIASASALTLVRQKITAQSEEVAHIDIAVTILIQNRSQHGATKATLALQAVAFGTQHLPQLIGVEILGLHLLGHIAHHQRSQHLQQLPGLVAAKPGRLPQIGLCTLLLAAKNVPQNATSIQLSAIGAGSTPAAQRA